MNDKAEKTKTARWWIAGGLVAVCIILLSVWFSRSQKPPESSQPAIDEHGDVARAQNVDDRVDAPEPTENAADVPPRADDAPADDQPDVDTINRLQQALRNYLTLPAGRISGVGAWTKLEFLKQHADSVRAEIDALVHSQDEHDRLLGAFLHLELYDNATDILGQAKHDPSVHVRAEVATWLYEQGRFDELKRLLQDISGLLTDSDRNEMRAFINRTPPFLDVPAGLAALRIGQAMPLFYRELARHDANIRSEILDIISEADMRIDQLPRYLEMLAFLQPDNQRQILIDSISNAEHLQMARYSLVKQLAALGGENDYEHARRVQNMRPLPPNGQEQSPVRFREYYVDILADIERKTLEAHAEQARQGLFAPGTLELYRASLLMTPGRAPMEEAVAILLAIEIPYMYRQQRQIVADILFLEWIETEREGYQ